MVGAHLPRDRWLEAAAKPRLREKSYRSYESLLRRYVRPLLGSRGITKELPFEVSFCLFRVLQDALLNAVNHSPSQGLQVLLKRGPDEFHLTVRHSGFDTEDARKAHELDLAIMKERLKLIAGEVSVESQRGHGTTIHARVPLNVNTAPQR